MENRILNLAFEDNKTFNWCGYEWECAMEGGRIISPNLPWYWMDKKQVYVNKNNEILLCLREKMNKVKHWDGKTYYPEIAGGTMRSVNSFDFGTFSMDIKAPQGYNLWPSFWLSGDENWPPEIDIFESWSYDNNYFVWTQSHFPWLNPGWKTTNNIHYNNDNIEHTHIGSNNISVFKQWKNPTETFVNYKVDWFPNEIIFYVNDKVVRKVKNNICKQLVKNLNHPEKSYKMDVIINVWCEDPQEFEVHLDTPMIIKNFKYIPYKQK